MQFKPFFLLSLLLCCFLSCQNRNAIDNIEMVPEIKTEDEAFANVYKILDGTWQGQFNIYEDAERLPLSQIELSKLSATSIEKSGIKKVNSIDVKQVYTSENPYFQRVVITDTYPGSGKQEVSKGVNKIQNGKMWCVVKKPSETIIHEGSSINPNTIVWQSDTKEKKEYFYETVSPDTYEIIGYGYYNKDDRNLSPKLWFYGKYDRVK